MRPARQGRAQGTRQAGRLVQRCLQPLATPWHAVRHQAWQQAGARGESGESGELHSTLWPHTRTWLREKGLRATELMKQEACTLPAAVSRRLRSGSSWCVSSCGSTEQCRHETNGVTVINGEESAIQWSHRLEQVPPGATGLRGAWRHPTAGRRPAIRAHTLPSPSPPQGLMTWRMNGSCGSLSL